MLGVAEGGSRAPFLQCCWEPGGTCKKEQRALTVGWEHAVESKQNPAWISEGTAKLLPHQGCSKSHRSSNDGKRSAAFFGHSLLGHLNTCVRSCILKYKRIRTDILLFLHFQMSQSGMSCLREENHLGPYFFVHKMGTILTTHKCWEKTHIKDCMNFNA